MNTADQQKDTLSINEAKDGDRSIMLHCEDGDVILSNGKQIISDSKHRIRHEDWRQEVHSLFEYVQKWVASGAANVRSWILILRDSQLCLFFCPEGESFDFDLAEKLAGLGSHIARNYSSAGAIEILQVAFSERDRFFNPDWEMFSGNLTAAH